MPNHDPLPTPGSEPGLDAHRLVLRLTRGQRELLEEACRDERRSVPGFALEAATRRAEEVLAQRTAAQPADARWTAFLAMLDQPVARRSDLAGRIGRGSVFRSKGA